jgi:hypothetical protein
LSGLSCVTLLWLVTESSTIIEGNGDADRAIEK